MTEETAMNNNYLPGRGPNTTDSVTLVTPTSRVTRTRHSDVGQEDIVSLWAEAEVSAKYLGVQASRSPISDKPAQRLNLSDSLTQRSSAPDPSLIQAPPPSLPGGSPTPAQATPDAATPDAATPAGSGSSGPFSLYRSVPADPRRIAAGNESSPIIARRPVAGIAPLRNSFATMEIVARDTPNSTGSNYVPLLNSSYNSGTARGTSNFLIHSVTETLPSSVTVTRTLTSSLLTSVGREPYVVQVVGYLVGSKDFPWISEWRRNYDLYLSADQCILRRAQVYLTVDRVMYVGYMLGTAMDRSTQQGTSWQVCAFNFDFFVTKVVDLALVESSEDLGRWLPQISKTIRGSDLESDIPDDERVSLSIRRAAEVLHGGDGEREFEFDLAAGTARHIDDFDWALAMAETDNGEGLGAATVGLLEGSEEGIPSSVLTLPPNLTTNTVPSAYV